MSDGPYRDLGSGFARLTGTEAPRRAPSGISRVEDALLELLKNARDAGAENVYVASKLRERRYRSLTVIDDGRGIPESYSSLIFEPGVTTRHLAPIRGNQESAPHGAGLALHHIKNSALRAELLNPGSPTTFSATFDTHFIPERNLQSETRPSQTNLLATTRLFATNNPTLTLFHASPAKILAILLNRHIIQETLQGEVFDKARAFGLEVSPKTVGRVLRGEIRAAERVVSEGGGSSRSSFSSGRTGFEGPSLILGDEDRARVSEILSRAARASYLEVSEVKFTSRPGEFSVVVHIHEPENEYD